MSKFFRTFWAWTGTLAGIAALYVGAVAIDKTLYFWIVIVLGFLIAIISQVWPRAIDLAIRLRNYPNILQQLGECKAGAETLSDGMRKAEEETRVAWRNGLTEGRDQILGAFKALEIAAVPMIVGILDDSGTIALAAKYDAKLDSPSIGARFHVVSISSGDVKGTVQITRVDEESNVVWMRCVEPRVSAFWEHLVDRVGYDESPPQSVKLERYPLPGNSTLPQYSIDSIEVVDAAGAENA